MKRAPRRILGVLAVAISAVAGFAFMLSFSRLSVLAYSCKPPPNPTDGRCAWAPPASLEEWIHAAFNQGVVLTATLAFFWLSKGLIPAWARHVYTVRALTGRVLMALFFVGVAFLSGADLVAFVRVKVAWAHFGNSLRGEPYVFPLEAIRPAVTAAVAVALMAVVLAVACARAEVEHRRLVTRRALSWEQRGVTPR